MRVELDYVNNHQNVDKGTNTISHSSSSTQRNERTGAFAIDISGTVMDNKAYGGQGKTAEDVMQEAAMVDVTQQKNYMTVMSNSMSEEDFAELQKEGYNPNNTDVEELVTVVDRIKTELVTAGVEVEGYTDTLDKETLEAITGNTAEAQKIVDGLQKNDVPVTNDNVAQVKQALDKAQELSEMTEGTMKYMVQNQMEPTIDNVYTAEFSSTPDGSRQGKGYYADATPGYYAKKAETIDFEQIMPQIEKVIEDAGEEINEDTIADAKWLVEKGVPLTEQTLSALIEVKQAKTDKTTEELINSITEAMGEGKKAGEALLTNQTSLYEKAKELVAELETISDDAVTVAVESGQTINLQNLTSIQKEIQLQGDGTEKTKDATTTAIETDSVTANEITAKRILAEVRLKMTVEANATLLKKGISIDTTELEQLVTYYKELEKEQNTTLFQTEDESVASEKAALYQETSYKVTQMASMPAAVIGKAAEQGTTFTLNYVYEQGTILQKTYQAADDTYEALMTAPRGDLGDSIKKAFRNVDDLLEEIDMEKTDTNRRAVRILGYNGMEVTKENLEWVKATDELVTRVVNKLTPAATLQMIRDNVNPLETDMESLEEYLSAQDAGTLEESEKYSKYLYKLEQNNEITAEERDAYIGVYRLVNQIEKSDGAVIGSLLQQGADVSFKNILSAVRTKQKSKVDVSIDDSFGAVSEVTKKGTSISEQINQINYQQNLAKDIKDTMEPSALSDLNYTDEMTLEELAEALKSYETDEKIEKEYRSQQLKDVRQISEVDDQIIQTLLDFDQPVTVDNLLAASYLQQNRGAAFKNLYAKADSRQTEALQKAGEELIENFDGKEEAAASYEKIKEAAEDVLQSVTESDDVTSIDVKSMALTFKQITLATNLAKEQQYEIPVQIGDEITSINLRIVHGEESGKVTATTQTEAYGKIAAEFIVTEDSITGFIATDSEEGLLHLKEIESTLIENLQKNGKQVTSLNMVQSKELNIQKFGTEKEKEASTEKVSSKELYSVAKELLYSLQNSKGSR